MVRETARFLRDGAFAALGVAPSVRIAGRAADRLPHREQIYIWSGWRRSRKNKVGDVRAEELALDRERVPAPALPVVLVGSASRVIVHLASMLGAALAAADLLRRAQASGHHPGDEQRYPLDIGAYLRNGAELRRISARHSIPRAVAFERVESFLATAGRAYPVRLQNV